MVNRCKTQWYYYILKREDQKTKIKKKLFIRASKKIKGQDINL